MSMEKDEVFLFKIKPGLVRRGYGIECAKQYMDADFIGKAEKYWQQIRYSI